MGVQSALRAIGRLGWVVGRWKADPGVTVDDVIWMMLAGVWASQALMLKGPESVEREVE